MVESDLSDLPTEAIRSALREVVENQLKSKNYIINVSSASKAGENNFIGVVYRASFYKQEESDNEKKNIHHLIVKVSPQNEARRNQFRSRDLFLREIYMYDKVLPFFREFEESRGVILEENGFIEYPKCYKYVDVEPSECIFLEDMTVRGFSIVDRYTEETTFDHACLVLKCLAKFHAISFALKDQQPDKFNELVSELTELFIRDDLPMMKDYYNKIIEDLYDIFSSEEDAKLLSKLKELRKKDILEITQNCVNASLVGPGTIITHGDCWQNNTMFRNDENKNPVEVSLLDWQIARHSSPVIDLVYYLFSCTTKELRDAHYDEFLNIYHETLSKHIQKLGSNPDELFPYKLMLDHLRKFGKYGLVLATMLLPMITNESGNTMDLDELAVQIENGEEFTENPFINEKTRHKFNKRIRGVVADMVRLEYI